MLTEHAQMPAGKLWTVLKSENPKGEGKLGKEKGGCYLIVLPRWENIKVLQLN